MSETGWAGFIAEHTVEESPAERAVRQARQAEQRDDRAAVLEEAERQARAEEQHEARAFRYAQLGLGAKSLGDVFTGAAQLGDEDAEYADCAARMRKIERRRAARLEAARFEAEQVAAVSRSAAARDPVEQASRRAAEAAGDVIARARQRARADQILRSASRSGPPFGDAAVADSAPAGCSDEQWAADGFCGCLRCFEREDAAQRSAAQAARGQDGACPHGYIPSTCAECRAARADRELVYR